MSINNLIFHQVNCNENREGALDTRQAEAISKYKPDIVLLEYPCNTPHPYFELNEYPAKHKPKDLVKKRTSNFSPEVVKKDPWVEADVYMWKQIANQWQTGKQIFVYPVDGPSELLKEWREVWEHMYPQATKNWVWWVQIYLREQIMANNISWVFNKHKDLINPVVNVYLQKFHWTHVEFLLTNPTPDEKWFYYFGNFEHEIARKDIATKIKVLNPLFYKYWQKYADF